MAIAFTLKHFLENNGIDYDLVAHPYASNALGSAKAAHVPAEKVAKCVILEDEGGYLIAVCAASKRIHLGDLYRETNRRLEFASEAEIANQFGDCVLGAVPPIGELYDMEVVVDTDLFLQPDIYFEAGDHEDLIHVSADAFQRIMRNAEHASFCKADLENHV